MSGKVIIAGMVICVACPGIFFALAAFASLMPGCSLGGSGGPAYGCHFHGISFDWLINFATPAFVLSFFTVPIGLLVCLIGVIAASRGGNE